MVEYYSTKTKEKYETEEKAFEAEREFDEKKAKSVELEETKKVREQGIIKAFEDAYDLLDEFVKDYGEFTGEIEIPFDVGEVSLFPSVRRSFFDRFLKW